MTAAAPWLIVGLGNPGPQYETTRHNIGALCADVLAERISSRFSKSSKLRADVAEGRFGHTRVVVAKPHSFMNESGGPTKSLIHYYKVPMEQVVVLHDELDIDFATQRYKLGGGDNGHNGLKSIRSALGSGEFLRVRLGIGRPPGQQDPADFVLRPFSGAERKALADFFDLAADGIETLVTQGLLKAQNDFNS